MPISPTSIRVNHRSCNFTNSIIQLLVKCDRNSKLSYDVDTQSKMDEMLESEKIEAIMRQARPQVSVIGVGGAGCNIVSWVKEKKGGVAGAKLIAANTDATHLSIIKADRRILLGEKTTRGMG